MCEQVNINVSETNETINIVSSEIQEVIDINVFETTEDVTLNITEQLIQVNVNKVTSAAVTNTSELINDGEDGVHPFITAEDLPSLTGYVPYTGATQDVNLGEFGLLTGNIEFENTPTNIPTTAGAMYWNDADGTADLILKGGNVKLQVGQESVIRVVNKTATNINLLEANYQAVRVTGAQGQRLKVDLAQATTDNLSAETIGLVTETINNNQEGFITTSGLVRNINTTGSLQGETWADGDILYLSPTTAGNVTKVKPVAPNHLVIVGYVVYAHANNGSIFVKVDNGYELDELHNVKITSAANNNVLAYTSATDIWENKTVETALGFTPQQQLVSGTNIKTINGASVLGSGDLVVSGSNIYNADGTLTGNRVVTSGGFTLTFTSNVQTGLLGVNRAFASNVGLYLKGSGTTSTTFNLLGTDSAGNNLYTFLDDGTLCVGSIGKVGTSKIQVTGNVSILGAGNFYELNNASGAGIKNNLGDFYIDAISATSSIYFRTGSSPTQRARIFSDGNFAINTNTNAGFRLDVNGTARVQGRITALNGANMTLTSNYAAEIGFNVNGRMAFGYNVASGSIIQALFASASADLFVQPFGGSLMIGENVLPNTSASVQINSTTKGFLPPRMTSTQKNAIATPAAGLVVYDTTDNKHYGYNGTTWNAFY